MRPLRLTIEGLRSFRTAREIDFTDLGLVAIVGDTGAGKSSILEAITYALYNGSTWDRRGVRDLISDGLNTMKVELDFTAEGETWRVIRSTSTKGYPPPIHSLQCLSDPERPRVDGEAALAENIRRLIGLDYDTFCSAVVLPQGRFQALLQATSGERTKILKSIFRLDLLTDAREAAEARRDDIQPTLESFRIERAKLSDDPKGAAQEWKKAAKEHTRVATVLDQARAELAGLLESERAAHQAAIPLQEFLDELGKREFPGDAFQTLLPQFADLDRQNAELDERDKQAAAAVKTQEARLAEAREHGESIPALEAGLTALDRLETELPSLVTEERDIKAAENSMSADARELDRQAEERTLLVADVDKRTQEREALAAAEAAAKQTVDLAVKALDHYQLLTEQAGAAQTEVAESTAALAKAQDQVAAAATRVADSASAWDEANRVRAELEDAHAAAHLAHGLGGGDPCPVCGQELPAGFKPSDAPGLEDARSACARAERERTAARDAAAGAAVTLEHAHALVKAQLQAQDRAAAAVAQARQAAVEAVGSGNDVDASRKQALSSVESESAAASRRLAESTAAVRDAERALMEFDAKLIPRRQRLEEQRTALVRRQTALSSARERLGVERSRVPARFRPDEADPDIAAARTATTARLKEVSKLEGVVRAATDERSAVAEHRMRLQREREQLNKPYQIAHDELVRLHQTVNDGALLVGDAAEQMREVDSVQDEAAHAEAVERRAEQVQKAVATARTRKAKEAAKANEAAAKLLLKLDVETVAETDTRLIDARAAETHANNERARYLAQIPVAEALDRSLGPLSELHAALAEVCRLLRDAQFIAFTVGRRQLALLGAASEILGTMTGQRYGFSKDFEIVDKLSGQPRSPRTLSGGESFLASLALALALVEMAARGGGRLEALFLDEGFGSLDADALDEALGELERRASAGQLVGVISHVSAVAERIETVMRVDRTAEGSVVRMVDQNARWEMVEEELGQGLLS